MTCSASTPPPLASASTALATTDSARSTASVAAPSGSKEGSGSMPRRYRDALRRPTTVTSGGSTIGSSPGSTPVRDSRYSLTGPGPTPAGAPACRRDRLLRDHPPVGFDRVGHAPEDDGRVEHVEQQEPAEGEVDRLGQHEVLAGLGDRDDLAWRGGGPGHLVTGERVGVDRIDPARVPDHLSQCDRDVPAAHSQV